MKSFKWDKKYLYWGVTAFCVVVTSILFFWLLNSMRGIRDVIGLLISVLSPVIYGFLIAYLLNKVLNFFERRVFSRLSSRLFKDPVKARKAARIFSILVTLLLFLGLIAALLATVLPELYNSVVKIVSNSEGYLKSAMDWLERTLDGYALEGVAVKWLNTIYEKTVQWLETNVLPQITTLITNITGGVISVVGTLIDIGIGIIISVYVMYNKETFCAQAKKLTYSLFPAKAANAIVTEMDFIDDAFGNYITGTIIDSTIVGLVNYIFMMITGMPYAILVSIIVGVTNLIPMFGPFIGAIPSALLILLENPTQCLIFIIFTLVLQQIDGQILKPRIHASRTGLSGFWIMFAILFFGGLFGLLGMVVGVPLTTVLYSLLSRLNTRILRHKGLPTDTESYRDLASIDPESRKLCHKPSEQPEQQPQETEEKAEKAEKTEKTEEAGEAKTPEPPENTPQDGEEKPGK